MKPIVLKTVAITLAAQEPVPDCVLVADQPQNKFGRKGVRTRLTKKQKAFEAAKHKRQAKRKQQQHTRAK